jgi:ferredoxin
MVRSEDSFNLWQSILRGAGVITGCRRCADVCPVGADYEAMLRDALDAIPETTPAKEARAAAMAADERAERPCDTYAAQQRWIGALTPDPERR